MTEPLVAERVLASDVTQKNTIVPFLQQNDLLWDDSVEIFIVFREQGQLIACGGLADNIIKCVAISEQARGQGIALTLFTELIHLAYELKRTHLFTYTKPENEALFHQCGFYTLASVPGVVVLMENSASRLQTYCQQLETQRHDGTTIGCIVMNANPFTLGHHYLVTQAAARCDWLHLFLVKTENPAFSYHDRLQLVRLGTQDITNLTVHEGSDYIISRATFPNYFIKDSQLVDKSYSEIDIKLFRRYIAPALNITHRFVGTEPDCAVTASYNASLRYWLTTPELDAPHIQYVEIERLMHHHKPISASRVRDLLDQKNFSGIASLVPPTTYAYLQNKETKNKT